MSPRSLTVFILFAFLTCLLQTPSSTQIIKLSDSPFDSALKTLQKQINYNFQNVGLLRRAMTHPSFSEENNRALSVLGVHIINAFVGRISLDQDIDMSSKELNRRIAELSNTESSCAVDGMRLGLDKVVRVASKTKSTAPTVICGAFRALFGAIAIDSGKMDDAGSTFWSVHTGKNQKAISS